MYTEELLLFENVVLNLLKQKQTKSFPTLFTETWSQILKVCIW